jgi:hypothetical protein
MALILLFPSLTMILLARLAAPLLVASLASACGGKTFGAGGAEPGEDSGLSPDDSGLGSGATDGSLVCVDVDVTASDLSCGSDQDCTLITAGKVCDGQCGCGDTPVNAAAAARYQSETASVTLADCPCAFPGEARCLGGQCTLCGSDPNQPVACGDAGTTPEDSGFFIVDGGESDSEISTEDGATCVDIDVSTYDQSCSQASDCILILAGEVCDGQCACSGFPVNSSEGSRYDEAISGIEFGLCGCPDEFAPQCIGNTCVVLLP